MGDSLDANLSSIIEDNPNISEDLQRMTVTTIAHVLNRTTTGVRSTNSIKIRLGITDQNNGLVIDQNGLVLNINNSTAVHYGLQSHPDRVIKELVPFVLPVLNYAHIGLSPMSPVSRLYPLAYNDDEIPGFLANLTLSLNPGQNIEVAETVTLLACLRQISNLALYNPTDVVYRIKQELGTTERLLGSSVQIERNCARAKYPGLMIAAGIINSMNGTVSDINPYLEISHLLRSSPGELYTASPYIAGTYAGALASLN